MTLAATPRVAGPFNGNGVTTSFPFTFKVFTSTDIRVVTLTSGIETEQVLNTDYTVTLNGDQEASPGGTVTYPVSGTPLPSGSKLTIAGARANTQSLDLTIGGSFDPSAIERALDSTVVLVQQLAEEQSRALTAPLSTTGVSFEVPVPEASKFIGWNDTADGLVNRDATDLASVIAYANWATDIFDGTGAQTAFALSVDPGSVHNCDVVVDDVPQTPGVAFTVSGTTITFVVAPPVGVGNVVVRHGQALPQGTLVATAVSSTTLGGHTYSIQQRVDYFSRPSIFEYMTPAQMDAVLGGLGVVDVYAACQAALNSGRGPIFFPGGVYGLSQELVVPDGSGIIGAGAHWKRRTGYTYNVQQTVLKYIGAGGANTCVVRASEKAVGVVGVDFTTPGTDDLLNATLLNFHVDCNNLAEYGVYVYRAGNQAALDRLTSEKAKKANHVHLGCYAARFGTFGAYESEEHGVVCGWDVFGWSSVESTNFSFSANYLTANNGTDGTYVAGGANDLDGSGGMFLLGRGSSIRITSESNDGRACILSQHNSAGATMGQLDFWLDYVEGNGDGPYVDYRDAMDGIRLMNGFLHPGNGGSLLPQNIKIDGKDNSGVTTAGSGPARMEEWLTLYRLAGDLSGVGPSISSNTSKYRMIECGPYFQFASERPGAYAFNLALEGATTPGVQTYALRSGFATRHGNMVTVTGRVTLSVLDGATAGQIRITGLPYRIAALTNLFGGISIGGWNALTTPVVGLFGSLTGGTSYISLTKLTAAGTSNLTNLLPADLSGTTLLQFTATYITDD